MSTSQTLVSVILCNYNYGQFIAQAIDSVLCQTYANFELIIVDDGSTDNSREIISRYKDKDPRIQTIFQKNSGQGGAFNSAFAVAKGEVVAFLDSDDWWKPEKLETVIHWHNFLQGNYAVLQHGLDVWENGTTVPYKLILPVGDCFSEMQRSGRLDFFVPTSGLSFRRAVLDKVFPIPTDARICADAYVMRTAFVYGKVYSIPECLGFYRKHGEHAFRSANSGYDDFLYKTIIPALNSFYHNKGIGYRISYTERRGGTFWNLIPAPARTLLRKLNQLLKILP